MYGRSTGGTGCTYTARCTAARPRLDARMWRRRVRPWRWRRREAPLASGRPRLQAAARRVLLLRVAELQRRTDTDAGARLFDDHAHVQPRGHGVAATRQLRQRQPPARLLRRLMSAALLDWLSLIESK